MRPNVRFHFELQRTFMKTHPYTFENWPVSERTRFVPSFRKLGSSCSSYTNFVSLIHFIQWNPGLEFFIPFAWPHAHVKVALFYSPDIHIYIFMFTACYGFKNRPLQIIVFTFRIVSYAKNPSFKSTVPCGCPSGTSGSATYGWWFLLHWKAEHLHSIYTWMSYDSRVLELLYIFLTIHPFLG